MIDKNVVNLLNAIRNSDDPLGTLIKAADLVNSLYHAEANEEQVPVHLPTEL
jgi:hypothetical protein